MQACYLLLIFIYVFNIVPGTPLPWWGHKSYSTDKTHLIEFADRVYKLTNFCDNIEDVLKAMGKDDETRKKIVNEKSFYTLGKVGDKFAWVRIDEDKRKGDYAFINLGKRMKKWGYEWIFTAEKNAIREVRTYRVEKMNRRNTKKRYIKKKLVIVRIFSKDAIMLTIEVDNLVCPMTLEFDPNNQNIFANLKESDLQYMNLLVF